MKKLDLILLINSLVLGNLLANVFGFFVVEMNYSVSVYWASTVPTSVLFMLQGCYSRMSPAVHR